MPKTAARKSRWNTLAIGGAVTTVLCSLVLVINTIPGASQYDFTSSLVLGGWSEENELRYQQLDACSERVRCMMSFADQKEYERLKARRPEHVEHMMAGQFGDMPNYFNVDPSGDR